MKLKIQNEAILVFEAYQECIVETTGILNLPCDNSWAALILRSRLDSAHKFFIGTVLKGTKLPALIDALTNYFASNLDAASQVIDDAVMAAVDDSDSDAFDDTI